jgi:hypothetical protein
MNEMEAKNMQQSQWKKVSYLKMKSRLINTWKN